MFDSRQTKEQIIEGGMALHARLVEAQAENERLWRAIRWALGEGPDVDGTWFGDFRPPLEAKYWWRQNLRRLATGKAWSYDKEKRTISNEQLKEKL